MKRFEHNRGGVALPLSTLNEHSRRFDVNHKTMKYTDDEVREILRTGEGLEALLTDGERKVRDQVATRVAEQYRAKEVHTIPCTHAEEIQKLRWEHYQETQKLNSQIWDLSFKKPTKEFVLEYDENGIPDMNPVWETLDAVVKAMHTMEDLYKKALSKTDEEWLEEKNHRIYDLQDEVEEKNRRLAELEAHLVDQQPQTDEQLQSRVATLTRFLHEQGYGLRDIDPTASDDNIMCKDCGRYYDGGCLLHGVPPEVADQPEPEDDNAGYIASDADLAQQQAAADDPYAGEDDEPTQEECDALYQALKDGTAHLVDDNGKPMKVKFPEDEDEPELDPAAPHGGSGQETTTEIVSPWYKSTKAEEPKQDPRDTLIADLRARLQESEQMRAQLNAAKDTWIQRNRALEAENETLKTQLEDALAKLAQYEGMGA